MTMMKLVATSAVFLVMLSMQAHHEAEGRVVETKLMKKELALSLWSSSLPKGRGKPPSPNPTTESAHTTSTTVNQRDFAGHNAARAPPQPPASRSKTMQLLFSMAATARK